VKPGSQHVRRFVFSGKTRAGQNFRQICYLQLRTRRLIRSDLQTAEAIEVSTTQSLLQKIAS
jgi:hypothetical protein